MTRARCWTPKRTRHMVPANRTLHRRGRTPKTLRTKWSLSRKMIKKSSRTMRSKTPMPSSACAMRCPKLPRTLWPTLSVEQGMKWMLLHCTSKSVL